MKDVDAKITLVPEAGQMPGEFNGLLYFSHDDCGVCKILRPKVEMLLMEHFPKLTFAYVDVEHNPAVAASYSVFTVPVILVFFEGKEFYRFSGGVSIGELEKQLQRPYNLKFT